MHSSNAEVLLDSVPCLGIQCAICFVVLQCCTGTDAIATAKFSVRPPAALDESDEKTWTTVPSTMRRKEREDTTTKSWYVLF